MKITVIIPCFNDGHFLPEAVNSVLTCHIPHLELIIVNDGSTDKKTLEVLNQYEKNGIKVLSHPNKGLAYTRNRGISEAKGDYILPLDADNKIRSRYVEKGIALLDKGECDIVYAKPAFFGADISHRKFVTHAFDGDELFFRNYIDACALYRKSVWENVGGYDEYMPSQGNEDWDFWLSSHLAGFRFKFLNEELYDYRIAENSMIAQVSPDKTKAVVNYMIMKHIDHFREFLPRVKQYKMFYENDQHNYLRTTLKYLVKSLKPRR